MEAADPETVDTKEDEERIADTNVEGLGGEEHRDLKESVAKLEKAWKGAGTKPGLEIWRIEKFKVKKWKKSRYGEFYSGDSYIVLHSEQQTDKDGNPLKMVYDVFFWLGKETSKDEAGTAAYKTVELDDLLGDEPTQYREVQGNESRQFLNLFKKLTILDGGIDSGFNKVKPKEYQPRLLKIQGFKDQVQVTQVKMAATSLNSLDAFILDAGVKLFMFFGKNCNHWEKRKAQQNVNEIKDARHGKVESVVVVDGLADTIRYAEEFWTLLGGKPSAISDEDEEEKSDKDLQMRMFKISDESGVMKTEMITEGYLDLELLDSNDTFVVDTMLSIYIWIGKKANRAEKKEAMPHAVSYLESQGRSDKAVPICRVLEGKEPPHFIKVMKSSKKGGATWDADLIKDDGFVGRRSSVTVMRDLQD